MIDNRLALDNETDLPEAYCECDSDWTGRSFFLNRYRQDCMVNTIAVTVLYSICYGTTSIAATFATYRLVTLRPCLFWVKDEELADAGKARRKVQSILFFQVFACLCILAATTMMLLGDLYPANSLATSIVLCVATLGIFGDAIQRGTLILELALAGTSKYFSHRSITPSLVVCLLLRAIGNVISLLGVGIAEDPITEFALGTFHQCLSIVTGFVWSLTTLYTYQKIIKSIDKILKRQMTDTAAEGRFRRARERVAKLRPSATISIGAMLISGVTCVVMVPFATYFWPIAYISYFFDICSYANQMAPDNLSNIQSSSRGGSHAGTSSNK